MCDELRGLISDQTIPISKIRMGNHNLQNNNINIKIQNHNSEDIDDEESIDEDFETLKPSNINRTLKKLDFIYEEQLEDYISEEDSDYNPTNEPSNKSIGNDIKCVSKFLALSLI